MNEEKRLSDGIADTILSMITIDVYKRHDSDFLTRCITFLLIKIPLPLFT